MIRILGGSVLLIRMVSLNDIDTLVKVRFDYFTAENWELSLEQQDIIEACLRKYYSEHLNTDFFADFAEDSHEIVSVAFLAISARPANLSFPTGKIGTILNVLTYPEHRRKGYATCTMNALMDEARRQDLSYIELSSSESGKLLYQKLGFVESLKSEHFTEMKLSLL